MNRREMVNEIIAAGAHALEITRDMEPQHKAVAAEQAALGESLKMRTTAPTRAECLDAVRRSEEIAHFIVSELAKAESDAPLN